jgi:crossover junction endodeoxyribonuclease RuvC
VRVLKILGIDPGYAIVGYGVVSYDGYQFKAVGYGAITTPSDMEFHRRLSTIYDDMLTIIDTYQPDCVGIEKLYFTNNHKTGIDVAQARGVTVLAISQRGVPFYEYTPLQIKQAITGYGQAEKRQVMEMTRNILKLKSVPKPDDTADALAVAICHGHFSRYQPTSS